LVPREIEHAYLRGVLVKEADGMTFMNAKNDKPVDPAAIIEMLVVCGLLNRNRINRRLQFAYDPVAEQLAAWRVAQGTAEGVAAQISDFVSARLRYRARVGRDRNASRGGLTKPRPP
jgi:hypothetical protein